MTADMLFWMIACHFIGDYVLQSDWMAQNKRRSFYAALAHVHAYTFPFVFLLKPGLPGIWQMELILLSHLVIDHYGLARYVCFVKNFLAPRSAWPKWSDTDFTGYSTARDKHLTVWLYIITDNLMHLLCNYVALRYL